MALFDDRPRTLLGGATFGIGAWDYLDASARPEADAVRTLLNTLWAEYPASHQQNLKTRIQTRNDEQYHAAVFELLLHGLLVRNDCIIEAVEPIVAGSSKQPDFLVRAASNERFYLEAVSPSGVSKDEAGGERRLNEALAVLDQVVSPAFFLQVMTQGQPTAPVPLSTLREKAQQWVNQLNPEAVAEALAAGGVSPTFKATYHGATFEVAAYPRRTIKEGRARAIGAVSGGVRWVTDHVTIADAVRKKAGRYGRLELPYVVAVNATGAHGDEDSVLEALFGTEAVEVSRTADGDLVTKEIRQPNGVWLGASGPINTRVSAVLCVQGLSPWSVHRRAIVCHNPWASQPLAQRPLPVDAVRVESDRFVKEDGRSVAELLGLPDGWPEA